MKSRWILLLLLIFKGFVSASPRGSSQIRRREPSIPLVTPFLASSESNAHDELRKRQITTQISTCGYHDGDPTKPRSAAPGFDCRVDTKNGLWGFCPTTVILASDCGLAGFCVDGSNCSGGCGILGVSTITTFTCNKPGQDFCSTALLIDSPDQTYSYIACAPNAGTEILFANPTLALAATSSVTFSKSVQPSSTSSKSTSSTSSTSSTLTSLPISSSSSSSSSISSQFSSAASSSTQSAAPGAPSSTETVIPNPPSKSNVGPIVGGVLGGLALIGIFVLATLYLMRKFLRNHSSNRVKSQQSTLDWGRDPKIVAGHGPVELFVREEPAELGT